MSLFCSSEAFYSFSHERLNSQAHEAGIRTIRRSLSGCHHRRHAERWAFSFPRPWSRMSDLSIRRSFRRYNRAVYAAHAPPSLRPRTADKTARAWIDSAAGNRGRRSFGCAINRNRRFLVPRAACRNGISRRSCNSCNRRCSNDGSGSLSRLACRRNSYNICGFCSDSRRRMGRYLEAQGRGWRSDRCRSDCRWIRATSSRSALSRTRLWRYPANGRLWSYW